MSPRAPVTVAITAHFGANHCRLVLEIAGKYSARATAQRQQHTDLVISARAGQR